MKVAVIETNKGTIRVTGTRAVFKVGCDTSNKYGWKVSSTGKLLTFTYSSDADCKPSEWPGCVKPVNAQNFDKMRGMMEAFKKGKCEEKPTQCKPSPLLE